MDTTEAHAQTQTFIAAAWTKGDSSIEVLDADAFGTFTTSFDQASESVAWEYVSSEAALNFLADGETLEIVYRIEVTDSHDASFTQDITVTVTGTNDAPVIAAGAAFDLAETADTTGSATPVTASGTLAFADVDLSDVEHSAVVTDVAIAGIGSGLPDETTLLGLLTLPTMTKESGSSAGAIDWLFSAPDSLFDYLSADEAVTLTYTIELDDGDGGTNTETIAVTVAGTNDAPMVNAAVTGAAQEGDAAFDLDLLTSASDVDNGANLAVFNVGFAVDGHPVAGLPDRIFAHRSCAQH